MNNEYESLVSRDFPVLYCYAITALYNYLPFLQINGMQTLLHVHASKITEPLVTDCIRKNLAELSALDMEDKSTMTRYFVSLSYDYDAVENETRMYLSKHLSKALTSKHKR